jgi:hypothetical protein
MGIEFLIEATLAIFETTSVLTHADPISTEPLFYRHAVELP